MRRLRAILALVLIASVLVLGRAPVGAGAGIEFTVDITPDPVVPFEFWIVEVAVTGCTPGEVATFSYARQNPYTDYIAFNPNTSIGFTTDGSGAAQTAFSDRAYPGQWEFTVACGTQSAGQSFDVPMPDNFAVQVSPSRVTRDEPFTIHLEGAGCLPGGTIQWFVAVFPVTEWAHGTTTAGVDGTWQAEGSGTITGPFVDQLGASVPVTTYCIVDQLVSVPYPVVSLALDLAPDDGDPTPDPPDVAPRFTG